ncbi:MAG: rod shape-determining protein MreD [Acidobacteriales bacterium]|nr:rod shape-determining protein MreD [Terriglobales bacterium]
MARFSIVREGVEVYRFSWISTVLAPLAALYVQASVPRVFPFFTVFDLPLMVTIFFSLARRNKIAGTVTGAGIGLLQDALTQLPLGLFGIAKTVIGYAASSIGAKVDVDQPYTRILLVFGFYLIHRLVLQLVRSLVQMPMELSWAYELGAALANALAAIVVFWMLDKVKIRK